MTCVPVSIGATSPKVGCGIASLTAAHSKSRHEAFQVRSGHLADALEDAELIEFTAAEAYRGKAEHVGKNGAGQ
jgi:hypothetical protein